MSTTVIYYLAGTDDNGVFCVQPFEYDHEFDREPEYARVASLAERWPDTIYFTVEVGPETLTPAEAIERLRVLFAERSLGEEGYTNFALDVGEILDLVVEP